MNDTPMPPPLTSDSGGANLGAAVQRVVQFFQQLTPQDLDQLGTLYAPDAHFKDPFNEVQGIPAIEGIFRHMFQALAAPHFVVTTQVLQDHQCFLVWEFRFRFLSRSHPPSSAAPWQTVRGSTHLVFNAEGRITLHRDYWDAAEELYEKLPLLGALMRWLKRRARG